MSGKNNTCCQTTPHQTVADTEVVKYEGVKKCDACVNRVILKIQVWLTSVLDHCLTMYVLSPPFFLCYWVRIQLYSYSALSVTNQKVKRWVNV